MNDVTIEFVLMSIFNRIPRLPRRYHDFENYVIQRIQKRDFSVTASSSHPFEWAFNEAVKRDMFAHPELLSTVQRVKRLVHNICFTFTGKEIWDHGLLSFLLCTGYAKVFYMLAQQEGLDAKVIASVSQEHYLRAREENVVFNHNVFIHGHRALAVKFSDGYRVVEAAYNQRNLTYATVLGNHKFELLTIDPNSDYVDTEFFFPFLYSDQNALMPARIVGLFDDPDDVFNSEENIQRINWNYLDNKKSTKVPA